MDVGDGDTSRHSEPRCHRGRWAVETDATDEQFARLVSETERRCPVTQLFQRSGLKFDNQWERLPLDAS